MSEQATLPKTYNPGAVEGPIYDLWLRSGAFAALPDERPPEKRYVIMMPLPNVTGALHMGHAMDNVMQDLLIRWHRMQGDNTLWMPGTDHAGIATQAVVEKRLKELEGLTRFDLGRDGLVERIWRWKDQYQARIVAQQQRMGCSCDWERQRFTMDAVCARAVRHWFFRMYADGLVFRGKRLVNWDPYLQTTISDDEVYHETVEGHFWHLRYPVIDPAPGEPEHVVVATTRPETMLGDTAVAVHPDPGAELTRLLDQARAAVARAGAGSRELPALQAEVARLEARQRDVLGHLVQLRDMARAGRKVRLPLLDREMPLIEDTWAKPELGSGCVKITPAHDPNDYDVWTRHKSDIGIINILNDNGTLNEQAGPYAGLDRFEARDRVVADLDGLGLLDAVEDRQVEIGHSDRSKTPVEPYLSDQWFVRMGDVPGGIALGRGTGKEHRAPGLVQAAMDAVLDGRVKVHPERYAKTYLDWLAEKRDWPISRQLWWGHRIPVWSREVSLDPDTRLLLDAVQGREDAVARLHHLEAEGLLPVEDAPSVDPATLPDGARCRLDICLLSDDQTLATDLAGRGFVQDPDVLDTWFSSALWPFSTLGWPDPATAEPEPGQRPVAAGGARADCLEYYYPGSCLVTARDIITLWVARMVLSGLYCLGDIPFTDVFIHANILDGKGERMSKSKGNGIDPVDIIEGYGTDAMRYVLCEMQTGTQDIRLPVTALCPACGHDNDLAATEHGKSIFTYICGKEGKDKQRPGSCGAEFDVLGTMPDLPAAKLTSKRFEVGRAFCTKLWNSARFALMNLGEVPEGEPDAGALALEDRWILGRLSRAVAAVHRGLSEYNPSAALSAAREFFWGELCDWYLELVKPRLQDATDPGGRVAARVLALCLDQVLRLLHPFLPFVTEELWQKLGERAPRRGLGTLWPADAGDLLVTARWPEAHPELEDPALDRTFAALQHITRAVREVRAAQGLPPRAPLTVTLKPSQPAQAEGVQAEAHVVTRLCAVQKLAVDPEAVRPAGAAVKVVGETQVFVHDVIDDAEERARLQKSLAKVEKEITVCQRKLDNPRFVERAPAEVVAEQRERLAGYQASREAIVANLEALG